MCPKWVLGDLMSLLYFMDFTKVCCLVVLFGMGSYLVIV